MSGILLLVLDAEKQTALYPLVTGEHLYIYLGNRYLYSYLIIGSGAKQLRKLRGRAALPFLDCFNNFIRLISYIPIEYLWLWLCFKAFT